MGFLDSTTKQRVTNVTTTRTDTRQADQSGNSGVNFANIEGPISFDASARIDDHSTNSFQVLDAGAIEGAFGLGKSAIDAARMSASDSIGFFGQALAGAFDNSRTIARDALNAVSSMSSQATQTDGDRISKVAMVALAALAAAFVLPALFKGKA